MTLRRCNLTTQLQTAGNPCAVLIREPTENIMLKLIAAAGVATLLAGCVVAPDAGYGYGQPYYSDPGYAYAPSPCTARSTSGAVAADATGIAAGATTIAGTAIAATAATAGGTAADAAATGTMAAEAAAIATDAQLQPFVSAHGPPMSGRAGLAGRALRRRPDSRTKTKALARSEGLCRPVRRSECRRRRSPGTDRSRVTHPPAYQPAGCA